MKTDKTLPYPFRSLEEWAQFLISNGLINEDAYYDPSAYDGGSVMTCIVQARNRAIKTLETDSK